MSKTETPSVQELAERIDQLEQENRQLKQHLSNPPPLSADAKELVSETARGMNVNRRKALALLFSGGAVAIGATGMVEAQANEPGAACTWRGDQNAAGYELFGLGGLKGDVTGNTKITDFAGSGLSIDGNGVLNAQATSANVPDWSEDGNSPFQPSGVGDFTGSLATTGQNWYLLLIRDIDNDSGSNSDLQMQASGTASGYDFVDEANSRTTGASEFTIVNGSGTRQFGGWILVHITGGSPVFQFNVTVDGVQSNAISYGAAAAASDFTSFTVKLANGANFETEGELEVYHK